MWTKKGKHANCLLGLRNLGLVFPSALQRIWGVLGVKDIIPPPEAAGIVADELLMVEIVVIGTSPEGKEMVKAPREFITTVSINGLEQAQDDPDVHGKNVEFTCHRTPNNRTPDSSEAQDHHFNRGGIFSSQAKRGRVLVVDFVNGLVEGTPMKSTVGEIMPGILHHKEDCNLICHGPKGREWDRGWESTELCQWVEEPKMCMLDPRKSPNLETDSHVLPDLGEFDGEMTQEHELGAIPLFP